MKAEKNRKPELFWITLFFAALMIITSPWQEISYYWRFSITGYRIFLLLTLVMIGLSWSRERGILLTELSVPLGSLLIVCFLSMAVAPSLTQSLRMIAVLVFSWLGFTAVVWLAGDRKRLLILLNLYLVAGLVSAGYGFFQFAAVEMGIDSRPSFLRALPTVNPVLREPLYRAGPVGTRIDAWLGDPNFLAGFMIAAVLLAVGLAVYVAKNNKTGLSCVYWSAAGICLAAAFLTYSRSGFVGLLAALLVLILIGWRLFDRRVLAGIGMTVVFVACFLFALLAVLGQTRTGLQKIGSILTYSYSRLKETAVLDPSTQHHLATGQAGLKMFARSPLTGVGVGNYGEYYAQHFVKGKTAEGSHSSYIQFFAETGVLGGLALWWTLLVFVLVLYRRQQELDKAGRSERALVLAILAGSTGLFVANIFYFYITHEYVWLYLGLGLAAAKVLPGSKDRSAT